MTLTKKSWVLAAAVVIVLTGLGATARADETDAAPASPSVTPVVRSANYEARERAHKQRMTAERQKSDRFAASARNGLFGLLLLVVVPTGMSIFLWAKRRSRRVNLPMSQVSRLRRACVVTGSTDDLERTEVKLSHTSRLGIAVGLISLISLFTGGILYKPGSRWIDLKLALSGEGRRLATEGQRLLALSHLSRVLLWAAFLTTSISLSVQLLWVVPLVAAMTVPALLAEKAASRMSPRCLGMTDDTISLEFGQASVAESIRAGVARAAARAVAHAA